MHSVKPQRISSLLGRAVHRNMCYLGGGILPLRKQSCFSSFKAASKTSIEKRRQDSYATTAPGRARSTNHSETCGISEVPAGAKLRGLPTLLLASANSVQSFRGRPARITFNEGGLNMHIGIGEKVTGT